MSKRRQSKSGSSKNRATQVKQVVRTVPAVQFEIGRKIQETLTLSAKLPANSALIDKTIVTTLADLISLHGADECLAVVEVFGRAVNAQDVFKIRPRFLRALIERRQFVFMEQLMLRWKAPVIWCLRMCAAMKHNTDEVGKQDLLAIMRRFATKTQNSTEEFDARVCLYVVGREPSDWEYLTQHRKSRFAAYGDDSVLESPVTIMDVEVLALFAQHCEGTHLMIRVVKLVEQMCAGPMKQLAERSLWGNLYNWKRSRVQALARDLGDSCYSTQIQRIASDLRDTAEVEELDVMTLG